MMSADLERIRCMCEPETATVHIVKTTGWLFRPPPRENFPGMFRMAAGILANAPGRKGLAPAAVC